MKQCRNFVYFDNICLKMSKVREYGKFFGNFK